MGGAERPVRVMVSAGVDGPRYMSGHILSRDFYQSCTEKGPLYSKVILYCKSITMFLLIMH